MTYLKYNLQFFQGEKTEEATPKKRRDARQKGQVVQSKDIGASASLLVIFVLINAFSGFFVEEIFSTYFKVMEVASDVQSGLTVNDVMVLTQFLGLSFFKVVLPIIGMSLLVSVIIAYMQVGFLFTLEPLKFKPDKISPIKGFKRLFSLKSLVEFAKSIFKAAGVLLISYLYITNHQTEIVHSMGYSLPQSIALLWDIVMGIVIRCSIWLFVLAILDYSYKKWENNKELRMSKQEIKDEYKQMEGDPLVRSKIKEKQRQMAMSRMMQEVPKADVIITNPTHFAVAIRYDQNQGDAPRILAKGKDLIAQNIKKVAGEHDVPIVENKPLAQALFASVEIGDYVPPDLFEAVADVLAYVYRLKNRRI